MGEVLGHQASAYHSGLEPTCPQAASARRVPTCDDLGLRPLAPKTRCRRRSRKGSGPHGHLCFTSCPPGGRVVANFDEASGNSCVLRRGRPLRHCGDDDVAAILGPRTRSARCCLGQEPLDRGQAVLLPLDSRKNDGRGRRTQGGVAAEIGTGCCAVIAPESRWNTCRGAWPNGRWAAKLGLGWVRPDFGRC